MLLYVLKQQKQLITSFRNLTQMFKILANLCVMQLLISFLTVLQIKNKEIRKTEILHFQYLKMKKITKRFIKNLHLSWKQPKSLLIFAGIIWEDNEDCIYGDELYC